MTEYFCYDYETNNVTNCTWSDPGFIFSSICSSSITTKYNETSPRSADTSNSTKVKVIFGVCLGIFLLVVIVVLLVFYYKRKSKKPIHYTEFDAGNVGVQIESNPTSVPTAGNHEGTDNIISSNATNQNDIHQDAANEKEVTHDGLNENDTNQNGAKQNDEEVWTRYDE